MAKVEQRAGEQLLKSATEAGPTNDRDTIAVKLDSAFVRSCRDSQRHFEVRVGNVETAQRGRQVFGAVAGWFHIAMRLQHAAQAANGLSAV